MALTNAQQKRIRNRYETHRLEIDDLVKIAVHRDKADAAYLQQLRDEYHWPDTHKAGDDLEIPWGMWCESVCQYIAGGPRRLAALAVDPASCVAHFYFSVSILSKIRTKESVAALCQIAEALSDLPLGKLERPVEKVADGFNFILCLKDAPEISASMERRIRNFLHNQLTQTLPTEAMASVCNALRGVGNAKSLELLDLLEDLPEPFEEDRGDAIAAIRKRLGVSKRA